MLPIASAATPVNPADILEITNNRIAPITPVTAKTVKSRGASDNV